jgi:hypothetical protein
VKIWWRWDGPEGRTIVVAETAFRAAEVLGIHMDKFQRYFCQSLNFRDLERAEETGESVWRIRNGKWKRIK